MVTRWKSKDPDEEVTVSFDYAAAGANPANAVVSIQPRIGVDPQAGAMLVGQPLIVGSVVLQTIAGGVSGVEYEVRSLADVGGDRLLIPAILPVVRRPTAAAT